MPFLLAPAGSIAALKSAIDAGADEVYLGGSEFNARMNAKNFDRDALIKASRLCRNANVGMHITLNTLVYDREFKSVLEYVDFLVNNALPDALIVQDLGLACRLREEFPSLPLHASTQMRIHSYRDAELLKSLGFTRAVLARELPKEDIARFVQTGLETEIFVHGAICVSESGGCLMSSVIGNRSGNRGECAQPCRLNYRNANNRYPLSVKDMCLATNIRDITEIGIKSLKIEGRMKSPEYVGAVTSVYRRLIDENRNATEREVKYLSDIFSRSGFTNGYFESRINRDMFGIRREDDKKASVAVTYKPIKAPKRTEYIKPIPENYKYPTRDDSNVLSPAAQKGLVLRFEGKLPSDAFFEKYYESAARIDIPLHFCGDERLKPYADKLSAVLPRSIFLSDENKVKAELKKAYGNGIRNATVSSINQIGLCNGFYLHGDYAFNVVNRETLRLLEALPFSSVMLSPETDGKFPKGSKCALEYIGYGRTPLMYTRTCIIANLNGCKTNDKNIIGAPKAKPFCFANLTDRTGAVFPIIGLPNHTNVIYNSLPAYRLDRKSELKKCGVGLLTLMFVNEAESEMDRIVSMALNGQKPDFQYTRK